MHIKAVTNTNIGNHLAAAFLAGHQGDQNIKILNRRQFHQAPVTGNRCHSLSICLDQLDIIGNPDVFWVVCVQLCDMGKAEHLRCLGGSKG